MSMLKCTMIFEATSAVSDANAQRHRVGGWSESYYSTAPFSDTVAFFFGLLCSRRAALLGKGASIVGQRYQIVDPAGGSQTSATIYQGSANNLQDMPQTTLHCRARGKNVANVRSLDLRGVPDDFAIEGEFKSTPAYTRALNSFFGALGGNVGGRFGGASVNWQFKGRNLASETVPIYSIDAAGNYQLEEGATFGTNEKVRILRANNSEEEKVGGTFLIKTAVSNTAGQLLGYTLGAATGGKMRREATAYPFFNPDGIDVGRIITRRVGRPSQGYSGKRTKAK